MFYASSGEPVLGINLYGDYGRYQLSEIGNEIKDRLELIRGVDKVTVVGDVKRRNSHLYRYGSINELWIVFVRITTSSHGIKLYIASW